MAVLRIKYQRQGVITGRGFVLGYVNGLIFSIDGYPNKVPGSKAPSKHHNIIYILVRTDRSSAQVICIYSVFISGTRPIPCVIKGECNLFYLKALAITMPLKYEQSLQKKLYTAPMAR